MLFVGQFIGTMEKKFSTSETRIYFFIILSLTLTGCSNGADLHNYAYSTNKRNELLNIILNMDRDKTVNTYLDLNSTKNIKITDRDKEVEIRWVLSAIEGEKGVFLEPKALDENLYNFIHKIECANLVKKLNRTINIIGNNDAFRYFDLIDIDGLVVIQYDEFSQKNIAEKETVLKSNSIYYNTPGGIFVLNKNIRT